MRILVNGLDGVRSVKVDTVTEVQRVHYVMEEDSLILYLSHESNTRIVAKHIGAILAKHIINELLRTGYSEIPCSIYSVLYRE